MVHRIARMFLDDEKDNCVFRNLCGEVLHARKFGRRFTRLCLYIYSLLCILFGKVLSQQPEQL